MIRAPTRGSPILGTSVPDLRWASPRLSALRRCLVRITATNRPFVTESRPVVGGIPLLPLHRQK